MSTNRQARQRIFLAGIVALISLLALVAGLYGRSAAAACDGPAHVTCTRVLFIGNSYTSENDLPSAFAALAGAGGHAVETSMIAPGGAYLADDVGSAAVTNSLSETSWNVVVLQEQSQIAADPEVRASRMDPAARSLAATIRASGALPVLFMTWAHRDGWPERGLAGYDAMQRGVDDGYLRLSHELGIPVAPVGYLWSIVRQERPTLELWQADGSHPSVAGTYLAACVFYALIFRQSPEGLPGADGLSGADARVLQQVAASVAADPGRWGIG